MKNSDLFNIANWNDLIGNLIMFRLEESTEGLIFSNRLKNLGGKINIIQ